MIVLNITLPINNDMNLVRRVVMEEAEMDGRILPWSQARNSDKNIISDKVREFLEYKIDFPRGKDPFKPTMLVTELSDDGYAIEVRMWSYDIPQRDLITSDLYEKVLSNLMKEGVTLYGVKKV
jgi:small-conductance mechanosensitive channel